jgi:hypothetical protein
MKRNDIKKALYRDKPVARVTHDLMLVTPIESISYKTYINGDEIYFNIPYKEYDKNIMKDEMPSQLLIRWLLKIKE